MAEKSNPVKYFLGGASCMTAGFITNPIDVIKIRLQLNSGNLNHLSVIERIKFISGGNINFAIQGLGPSMLRESTYSTMRMGLYEPIRDTLDSVAGSTGNQSLIRKIMSGAMAGAIASSLANPTDLVKIRLQAKDSPYSGMIDCFTKIIKKDGFLGLYRGVLPTTIRAMILTASQLPSYDQAKQYLKSRNWSEGIKTHLACSLLASFVVATTTSPVDVIKSRWMNQNNQYKSVFHCAQSIFQQEGFLGFYKGYVFNWLRIGPHTVITFLVYESLRRHFGVKPL
eukprot:NODE_88_length_21932_cov_0.317867.p10 type:complete len:283 gc:universal NODE_88_length_21932_cov_0.317867:18626-17778(-)